MDIVTLGAALNGSAEYVSSHFKGGSNIQIVDNPDGTQTINASGEVSSEDTVARAEIAAIKDGETLDSFGDVETALGDKADKDNVYRLALTNADLLPANTDLDNVKTAGCYYVLASSTVSTITNRPTENTSAFRVTVEFAAGEKRPRQIYQEFNAYDKYMRYENSSGVFGSWKKVEGDLSTIYTKTAVDTALGNKADKSTTYTKTEVDTALSAKADKSTTYTKTEVDTALDDKVDKETGKGLSTNDYTTGEKAKLAGIAEGAEVNVQSNWTQTTTTADDYIKNKPTLGTAASKNATDTYNATGTDVTTGKAVAEALATLPEPMMFKGSLGTGGTITTLPTASSSNKGYVYKVITAGTYASQSAKVGDTFISDGSAWVLIPSGDEPGGTVTNVAVTNGGGLTVSGSPITSSGTITVGHSNSVTAKTSSSLKKFTYDAYGHVTGSSELSTAESDALASGIDSTKVEQIETNKNNISTIDNAIFSKNLFNINTFYENAERSSSTGEIISNNAGYGVSEVIPIDNSKAIYFTYNGEPFTPTFIYIYDTNGNFSMRVAGSNPYIPTQYHGAISACFPNAKAPLFQMEYGSATAYEPYKNIDNFEDFEIMAGVNMFGSIAGVGDSYTAGYSASKTGTAQDMPNQSYIATIGKRAGVDWYNYGVTGATAKTYTTTADGLPKILSDGARDLYIINLGQNDINVGSTVGTTADIHDDWTLNPDTFCGNMGKIIAQIRNHAPKSKIILVKSWLNTKKWGTDISYQSLDDTIQSIADYYHIPCISPYNDCFFYSRVFQSYRVQGHPTTMGYAMMGIAMERLLSKCIVANPAYFQYATIG